MLRRLTRPLGNTHCIVPNPVQEQIFERLRLLPPACVTIAEYAAKYARYCASISTDDTLQIAHTPWVAPEAYAIRLFAPAKKSWFQRFRKQIGFPIPAAYRDLLLGANGCRLFGWNSMDCHPRFREMKHSSIDPVRSH